MYQREVPLTEAQKELHTIYCAQTVAKLPVGEEAEQYFKQLSELLIQQSNGVHDITVAARLIQDLPSYLTSAVAQFVKTSDTPESSQLGASVKIEAYAALLPHLMRLSDATARVLPALTFRFMLLPALTGVGNAEQRRARVNEYYHAIMTIELKERDNPPLSVPERTAYAVLATWKLVHEACISLGQRIQQEQSNL